MKGEDSSDRPSLKMRHRSLELSDLDHLSAKEIKDLLQDLSVHQAELEMQNDQLRTMQHDLRASQQKFYQLYYKAPVGYLTLDESGLVKQCNEKFSSLVARDELSIIGKPLVEFVDLSDRTTFEVWQRTKTKETESATFKFFSHNSKNLFLNISTMELQAPDEGVTILVTCTDVSSLKQVEEALRVSGTVFQSSSAAAMVVNADHQIIAINPAFTTITGYSEDEAVGKNPKLLNSGQHDNSFYQSFYRALHAKHHWEGEIWNRRKNGEVYPEWLSINVLLDNYGNPNSYVCVFSDESKHKKAQEIIQRQASHDALTELPNRLLFNDRLEQAMLHANRNNQQVALLFIDLDGFKDVNDTQGHHIGDLVLKETARRLCDCIRETDTVARLGGDEFAIILSEIYSTECMERLVGLILDRIKQPFQFDKESAYVTASIGITFYPTDADNITSLLQNADQAMYASKSSGKNSFKYFTDEMQAAALSKHRITNDLHASRMEDFSLHYQPIIELSTGSISKAEALVRWTHPEQKNIGPDIFIPIAEESGLIIPLGDHIFKMAARDVAHWRATFNKEFQVSVNKSPIQFRSGKKYTTEWINYLHSLNLPGSSVVIEITEGLLLERTPEIENELLRLRDLGMEVALDDFGTGYSSLSYLKKFDIDYIKIDQSFVYNLEGNSNSLALCEAIILMAHKLGLKVIAEGIETAKQKELLTDAGCDYGQGYFFSRPIPKEQFEEFLSIQ